MNLGTPLNALDPSCCAWTHRHVLVGEGKVYPNGGNICGEFVKVSDREEGERGPREFSFTFLKDACCKNQPESTTDCDSANRPQG